MSHKALFTVVVGLSLIIVAPNAVLGSDAAVQPDPTHPVGFDEHQLLRVTIADDADLKTLRGLETFDGHFAIQSEWPRVGVPVEVLVTAQGKQTLDASGLRYEIVHSDFQKHLDAIFAGAAANEFFDSLRTYDEHNQFMTDLATQYPDLTEMFEIGRSVQDRPLWALRITGPHPGRIKPAVFYHGAQHGNEVAAASVVAFVAHHILSNYHSDPDVAALVDGVEWLLLPISNPDGYIAYTRHNANNVNINRNWGGPGSGEDQYSGPYPFSEPETAAMRDLILANPHMQVHIDVHGYVPWLMWAWGHKPDFCDHHFMYKVLGAQWRNLIEEQGGGTYEFGTIYDVAYWVSGGSVDYIYGETFRHSFVFELNHSQMPRICNEFLPPMVMMAEWIAETDCNANWVDDVEDIADGTSADVNGNGIPDECETVLGDINVDGVIGFDDLLLVLDAWGPCPPEGACPADLDGNGVVDFADVLFVLGNWG